MRRWNWSIRRAGGYNRNVYVDPVAKIKGGTDRTLQEMLDVARLISAAPEMRLALREAELVIDGDRKQRPRREVLEMIRAALAKAEGRIP